jgi:glucose-1-phosphate adenylyltransferase
VILMGGDYYESHHSILENEMMGKPRIGIGQNTQIENAIIDKNARIGDHVRISPAGKTGDVDHALYHIRDGVVIIPKNGVIPHGMVI